MRSEERKHVREEKEAGRNHEKVMKELDIKQDEAKALFKAVEHDAKMKVCEVFMCWSKELNKCSGFEEGIWREEEA